MSTSALDGVIRDGRHLQSVRVYYEDTDFSGVVYHASYLRFMERGRTNYLRLLGADQRALFEEVEKEAPGFAFVVRSMTIDFRKPARMDDVLEIATAPLEVKGASVVLHQRVNRDGETLVEATVQVAFVSGGRARPIPKALRDAMKADSRRAGRRLIAQFCRRRRRCHVSTFHMSWKRGSGPRGLPSRQPEGGAGARRPRTDRRERARRIHLRRCRALGRRQPGGALSPFPRPR